MAKRPFLPLGTSNQLSSIDPFPGHKTSEDHTLVVVLEMGEPEILPFSIITQVPMVKVDRDCILYVHKIQLFIINNSTITPNSKNDPKTSSAYFFGLIRYN